LGSINLTDRKIKPVRAEKAMKICIFIETYYPVVGGGENQAKLLAEGLIDHGISTIIITRRTGKNNKKHEFVGKTSVYRIPPPGKGVMKKWSLILTCIPALIHLRNHYDIIFVSGYRIIGISAIVLCKILRKKCILKADSLGEMSGDYFIGGLHKFRVSHSFFLFKLFLKFRNYFLKKADAFTVISKDIYEELISQSVPPKKIFPIPNSVDTLVFSPATQEQKILLRKNLLLPETARIVIYTGRLVTYKGLPLLLEVWNDLKHIHKNLLLLILGTGGMDIYNCEGQLHDYVRQKSLENSVRFTGNVNNVSEYLRASDIFVFPTENEAFGVSLIEAMACALPVITTPVGGIKSIVTSGKNGLLVEPGNYKELYAALENLITNQTATIDLGQAAYKSVNISYSTEIVVEKYIAIFHGILEGNREIV
jgi:glycosyltransferase involved in cell wall biosynthesis